MSELGSKFSIPHWQLDSMRDLEPELSSWVSPGFPTLRNYMKKYSWFFFFFSLFWLPHSIWSSWARGSDLSHSGDLSHSWGNTESLITVLGCDPVLPRHRRSCCATAGTPIFVVLDHEVLICYATIVNYVAIKLSCWSAWLLSALSSLLYSQTLSVDCWV